LGDIWTFWGDFLGPKRLVALRAIVRADAVAYRSFPLFYFSTN
jgi:hypothetical protein